MDKFYFPKDARKSVIGCVPKIMVDQSGYQPSWGANDTTFFEFWLKTRRRHAQFANFDFSFFPRPNTK